MIDVRAIREGHTPAPERKWHRGQWRYDLCRRCKMVHPCPTHRLTLLVEKLTIEIGHWVMAYGPDLIVYPSKEEIRAVNRTPEFEIGRNATMQVVSEGLQSILAEAQEEAD